MLSPQHMKGPQQPTAGCRRLQFPRLQSKRGGSDHFHFQCCPEGYIDNSYKLLTVGPGRFSIKKRRRVY